MEQNLWDTSVSISKGTCPTQVWSTSQELGFSFSALQKTLLSWPLSVWGFVCPSLGTGAELGCSVLGVVAADAAGDPLGRRWGSWWWTQGHDCPPVTPAHPHMNAQKCP